MTEFKSKSQLKKVVLCISEDWFAASHFTPLINVLCGSADEVTIITNCSRRPVELEKFGVKVINFDYQRSNVGPIGNLALARKLIGIISSENPSVLHCVSMKPIILGALATLIKPVPVRVFHTTGLGHLATSEGYLTRFVRKLSFFILNQNLQMPSGWLLAENPDDLEFLENNGVAQKERTLVVGGSGVDPVIGMQSEIRDDTKLISATIAGRMIKSKGIEDVVEAHRLLAAQGVEFLLDIFGDVDEGNPHSLTRKELENWAIQKNVRWHGHVHHPHEIWSKTDIAIIASRDREGLPRSMLEAASYSRPLVVTDIPGCRHFVRDHIEGIVVPPRRPELLAKALLKLIQNQNLRQKLGKSARQRVVGGYTVEAIKAELNDLYAKIKSMTV